jgi:2-haloacid dehalogenase
MKPRACIFDAYGTLFDVYSIIPDLPELSALWRRKQLEYTWLLAVMERYKDFREVTESALRSALRQLHMESADERIGSLMAAYQSPAAFPEVQGVLERFKGIPLAILSNGTARMVEAAVANSGLAAYFAHIISVDQVRTYKPSPRVYALGPEILGIPAPETLFVSANAWDAAGAKAFGYQVFWCNRSGAPADDMGFTPDRVVSSLDEVHA